MMNNFDRDVTEALYPQAVIFIEAIEKIIQSR